MGWGQTGERPGEAEETGGGGEDAAGPRNRETACGHVFTSGAGIVFLVYSPRVYKISLRSGT